MTEIQLPPPLRCVRCGHEWRPRIPTLPRRCPNCKDARWGEPFKRPRGDQQPRQP